MIKDIAIVSHQGGRKHMEDSSFLIRDFGGKKNWILGGVYDGHGGNNVALLAASRIPKLLLKNLNSHMSEKEAFKKCYEEVCNPEEHLFIGCCALTFFLKGKDLYVANSGDGRMIIVSEKSVKPITRDHRISDPDELERILKAGGTTYGSYACKGDRGLMPTRTLGDGYFKDIGIISEPEVLHLALPKNRQVFLVAATDGLWDKRDNEWVAEICHESKDAKTAAEAMLFSVVGFRSEMPPDNVSIIVIRNTFLMEKEKQKFRRSF